jgi:hypothetical protein
LVHGKSLAQSIPQMGGGGLEGKLIAKRSPSDQTQLATELPQASHPERRLKNPLGVVSKFLIGSRINKGGDSTLITVARRS